MKIGVVDLDTSHPAAWIPLERELGHEVAGVWDGGTVHPPEYVKQFAADHGIPEVYPSLEAMAAEVDCAIVHGCDWGTHVAKTRPFVESGKSVLIDKPIAGNLRDLRQIQAWVREGARISGGSSLRFANETRRWLATPEEDRGTPATVFCGCAVDEFNYGIHAYALLSGIMGPGAASVQHLSGEGQHRVRINWADGRIGFVVIGPAAAWLPFYASIVTEKAVTQYTVDSTVVYRALLEAVLPYLAGDVAEPPAPIDDLIEPELCALAARHSWSNDNCLVSLSGTPDDAGYDGAAFAEGYRRAKYP